MTDSFTYVFLVVALAVILLASMPLLSACGGNAERISPASGDVSDATVAPVSDTAEPTAEPE
ncbi:MAG: hypothetical protein J5921_02735, partial [Clostridia bacterium]|nr:hypothetical protein [Clostridia bacterium]